MSRAMMDTAERNREFIARLPTKRARLHETQVMRIRRLAGAQKAWLEGDVAKMLLVAVATRRTYLEHALVDPLGLKLVGSVVRVDALRVFNPSWQRSHDWRLDGFPWHCRQPGECLLARCSHPL